MHRHLLADMNCPYCAGTYKVSRECQGDATQIRYGLIECRCFQFPIVDGVLLLSLNKGYGGAEEELQPYAPLQVAAVQYLLRDDVAGLLNWMRRHLPLAVELIENRGGDYLDFYARMNHQLEVAESDFLAQALRHEVVGYKRPMYALRKWIRRLNLRRTDLGSLLCTYFISRFFAPRVNSLAVQLGKLPLDGRILSLCCGQGVFENLLSVDRRNKDLVCLDGQFLNLLITRNYIAPHASFICHDVQFPLPFNDGSFDGVFSSTCLPEIPAQRTFAREAIRVTSDAGWTFFDSVWGLANGIKRLDPRRHYRFCQNFFTEIADYLPFFESCAPAGREVRIDIPATPDAYYDQPRWVAGEARASSIAERRDTEISALVIHPARFRGYTDAARPWLNRHQLAVSPVFEVVRDGDRLHLRRRAQFASPSIDFAAKSFSGYPESLELDLKRADDTAWLRQLFDAGVLTLLPQHFGAAAQRLH